MMNTNLICSRSGENVPDIDDHGDAYVIGESLDQSAQYLVTPDTGHVWYDAHGSRCADVGCIDCPELPDDDASAEEWEAWASSVIVAAHEKGVRVE